MFNRSKALLVAGLSLVGALAVRAPVAVSYPERRALRGKPITSRFFWGGRRWRVPLGGGAQEVERRRRQIEAGTLLTTEGHIRLHASRVLRQGQERVVYQALTAQCDEAVLAALKAAADKSDASAAPSE